MNVFYGLKIFDIFRYTWRQNASFKLLLIYMVFEYLRPQGMYPAINVIPWTLTILVACTLSLIIEKGLFSVATRSTGLILTYVFIVFLSSIFALSFQVSLSAIKKIIVLFLAYVLIVNIVDDLKKMFVFMLLFILLSLKLSQFTFIHWVGRGFAYDKYGATTGLAWLQNSGELAIQMCILFAISVYFSISVWKYVHSKFKRLILVFIPISAVGSVIACGSRGSYLAMAVVLILMWLSCKRKALGAVIIVLLIFIIPMILSDRDLQRTREMGSISDTTAVNRLERWGKGLFFVQSHPVLGVGYNNWSVADKIYYNGDGALCHNIFIECTSETGLTGLLVFLLLIVSNLKKNFETVRLANTFDNVFAANLAKGLNLSLIAYLVAGFFVTVFYYPYFWINFAMSVSLNNATKRALYGE